MCSSSLIVVVAAVFIAVVFPLNVYFCTTTSHTQPGSALIDLPRAVATTKQSAAKWKTSILFTGQIASRGSDRVGVVVVVIVVLTYTLLIKIRPPRP